MKSRALCAMMMALAWGAEAMSSNTKGVRGKHRASLLSDFHQHSEFLPDNDVGPMLKSAESMLMDLASRGGGTPLADLVAQIRPYILRMQDSIRTAHTSAQQILTNFGNDFSGCSSAKSTGEAEAAALHTAKTTHSNDHKACRTLENNAHTEFTACESTVDTLEDARDSSCQLYADAERTPGCGAIPPNPAETWRSYVIRAATWFRSEADSYVHKENVCNNDTAKVVNQTTTCTGSDGNGGQKKQYEDKKVECDTIQSQLETTTCSHVTKVDDTCESFASCKNTVVDGYESQLTGIQTMEQQRKVEWNATERLLCLLEAYGADGSVDATKLQTCQLIGDNTSHLNLVYPTATARPDPCPDLLPHPCGADYISQEYGSLDAPAADCTPCAFPAPGSGAAPGAPAQCESSATPPGAAGPRTSSGSSLTISGYDSRMLDSSGCIKTYDRSPGGTLSWGECMPGWPTTGIKALEGGQFASPVLLMESGEIYCNQVRFCQNANADGVGTLEYPDRTSDPAVQISVGSENIIILTQSGNVYTLGQARFDVVQRNVNGVGSSDTWIWEAKPVVGLPQDVVRVNMFHSYGAYGAIAVTQSGQIWGWGGRIARITAHKITPQGHNPAQMSWTPPDGSQWLDAKLGGYHALFGRTTTNKLYAMGEGGCTQFIGGSGGGPHEIVLPQINGAEDPIKNYWSGYQVLFVLGESNKLYSVGGTEPGFCGENGVSAPLSCTASPNPVQLASLEGLIPVQVAGYYEAPNMALMDNGEIYMWGRFSAATPCPGRTNFNGGPTPVLVGAGSATVPLPACPLAGAPGAQSSPQSQASAAVGPAAGSAPGAWLHLNVASIADSASDGDKIHTWPAVNDAQKDLVAENSHGFTDVEFKTSGPFSGRPAMVFTERHILCSASSHPAPQELTIFWKGTMNSNADPAHVGRTNWAHLVSQDDNWSLKQYDSDDSKMLMEVSGRDWGVCVGESVNKEPIIIVGTVTGATRTISVHRDSDMSLISTVTTSEGVPIKGESKKICMGFQEFYWRSIIHPTQASPWDFTQFHGEVEQVVVYDKLLSQADITQVVNSLHNQQVPAAVA